jgi:hypothetical protein
MDGITLAVIYFSETNCLHFASEEIQSLIIKEMDIKKAIHFSTMELETTKYIQCDSLLSITDSFYNLIQEKEDSLRYPGFSAEFSNGIVIVGDLNLSFICAPNRDQLFEFSSFIFESFNLNVSECKLNLLNSPGKLLNFSNK